jgi:hypothetical protein
MPRQNSSKIVGSLVHKPNTVAVCAYGKCVTAGVHSNCRHDALHLATKTVSSQGFMSAPRSSYLPSHNIVALSCKQPAHAQCHCFRDGSSQKHAWVPAEVRRAIAGVSVRLRIRTEYRWGESRHSVPLQPHRHDRTFGMCTRASQTSHPKGELAGHGC